MMLNNYIVNVNGSLVWTMSSNREGLQSQLRRVVCTASRASEIFILITGLKFSHCRVEVLFGVYVILLRKSNLDLYLQSLAQILLWMFALGLYQTHYSMWLSVRIRDMMSRHVNHPDSRAELRAGKLCTKQAASVQQWSSINVMSSITMPSK